MRAVVSLLLCLILCGCNSVYYKPHTLDTDAMIYIPRNGYSMKRSIKQTMDNRGYKTNIGKLKHVSEISGNEIYEITKDSRYAVRVDERTEKLRPIWCVFNGFWWWNFNVSIIDRTNNSEILSWRGRGCANSSLRKLNAILDELEMPKGENAAKEQKNAKTAKVKNTQDDTDYETLSVLLSDEKDD